MNAYERSIGQAALRTLGRVPNIIKCVEELAELQQALCKYLVGPVDADTLANVHEEIADASIMLGRMLLIFDPTEVQDWKDSKLDAMAERLGIGGDEGVGKRGIRQKGAQDEPEATPKE